MRSTIRSRSVCPRLAISSRRGEARRQSGVTFIELLITMVILMVGLLGALELIAIAITTANNAQKVNTAKSLALDTFEQVFIMRDMNALGGMPPANNRDADTFVNLSNGATPSLFPTDFRTIKKNIGADLIRGTNDDSGGDDPRYTGYQMRILVRSASAASNPDDPTGDPLPGGTDSVKRVIIEVQFPFLRTGRTQTVRVETYITKPPSQTRVGVS
ncbi:MAG TPA: prepilin-type N-terminal cleavage/methylation domain-containing protein [Acidobacteriota bacterium]|nr:prepilin-type N-terminal cleavage/methylation domain-containing protein [Acidobacteriota bacterium]HNC44000.1 prepilin-type N-terminal cleavage/methylation domain-containing protein [Acidobacteriota bacterium]